MLSSEPVKLTVIVTTYNRAVKLEHTLATLHAQTRQPDELIVSDDCSSDATEMVVRKWSPKFRNLRYSRNTQNLRMPGNLNAAMALARGSYIANLHDADTFQPQLLEKWEEALDNNPTAGFVFCGTENRFEDPERAAEIRLHEIPELVPGQEFFIKYYVGALSGPIWGTVMGRKSVYDEVGPYDRKVGWLSDVDMRMRMCARHDVAYVREPLLIIDNEVTAERIFRWDRLLMHDLLVTVNIRRIFFQNPEKMARLLRIQRNFVRRYYLRILLGRVYHWDWKQVGAGLRLLPGLISKPPAKTEL